VAGLPPGELQHGVRATAENIDSDSEIWHVRIPYALRAARIRLWPFFTSIARKLYLIGVIFFQYIKSDVENMK
jgi:hypothetical protein